MRAADGCWIEYPRMSVSGASTPCIQNAPILIMAKNDNNLFVTPWFVGLQKQISHLQPCCQLYFVIVQPLPTTATGNSL